MRYVMKQKLFSWGDDFLIRNEAGQEVFFVDGRALSLGDKLWSATVTSSGAEGRVHSTEFQSASIYGS